MKKYVFIKKGFVNLGIIFFLLMSYSYVFAQQKGVEITGRISDKTGPLPGVSVVVKGSDIGTITNTDGTYLIKVNPQDSILVVSFVGMKTIEVPIDGRTVIDVEMEAETYSLDEVVAVGYGYKKKKSLTGAVSNIRQEDIVTTSTTSLAQKLSGKISGLNIRQTTGEPGAYSNSINIRGFGEPLFVIDGIVRGSSADFQRLNAEDIESISVLKDASAAIYGLNAANGVVIVTTKKGAKGKARFRLSGVYGLSAPTDVPEMANATQYLIMRNEANVNAGLEPFLPKEELDKWITGEPGYESTDWNKATFKNNSFRSEHVLTAEGGTDKVSYFISSGLIYDNGLLLSGDINYKKFNYRANLSANLTDNITANVYVSGFNDERNTPVAGSFNIWRGAVSSLPVKPVYANNNPKYLHRVQDGQAMNPVALAQSDLTGYTFPQDNKMQITGNLIYKAPFLKGLEFKGVVAFDQSYNQVKSVAKEYQLYDFRAEDSTYLPTAFNKPSFIINGFTNSYLLTLQAQAAYKTVIADKHNISATVVFEQKESEARWAGILKYYEFFTNAEIDQAGEENAQSWGNESQARNRSYLGRLNYDFKGKYLFEFAGRYDGSYRYAPNMRWGFFPVVSAGWRLSEENFIKDNIGWISNLKLRGSVGIIGQDVGAPFQYVPGFSTAGGGWWEYTDGVITNGAASPAIVNKNLTWMESEIKDIGIDLGFFGGKLSFVADVYQRDRTGLLAYRNVSLPNTFGGTLPQENLNSDRVRGMEFSFIHDNAIGEFHYNITGNMNLARSMNVHVESSPYTSSWERYRAGQSNRWNDIVWTYNVMGQFQSEEEILNAPIQDGIIGNAKEMPGDFRYEDVNGDGVIDGNDMVPDTYNSNPKIYYGMTFNASWKGFDFNILLQGAAMYTVRYNLIYTIMFWEEGNIPAYFMDRWHMADPYDPDNTEWVSGKWPAIRTSHDVGMLYAESELWRRDASYLRIKNIEIGYTVNSRLMKQLGVENLRVYTNILNLFTFADPFVKPFDPEASAGIANAGWRYPILKTYNFGFNLNF